MKQVLVILWICLLASCSTKESALPDKGVSFELNEFRKKSISDVSYSLALNIPKEKKETIIGTIAITFALSDKSQPVVLDFRQDKTSVKSVTRPGTSSKLNFTFENEHIILDANDLIVGTNTVAIEFTAGDLSLNRNDNYLYTLFVPDRASTCVPLFDQPDLKANWSLSLNVPSNWKAVSNGALMDSKTENGNTTYSFQQTRPISSYIFAFAAGEFKSITKVVDGRAMTMYYRETDSVKVKKNQDEIFSLHGKSIAWLEDYTSIPYPFDKFDFALIPSFQYGGMEHPGSIFYNESSLFLDDNASVNRKMGRASLIAHETAHMWFGDLVTMDWFNDVWMKEVFANFMAAKIVQPSFVEIDHDLRFLLSHYPGAYSVDRTKGANPIIQPLDNLKNAGTMYGAIIYQKAPIVMRHLEVMIGEDIMKESLHEYLETFAYRNAVWDDLVKIIDKRAPQDIAAWSNEWVHTPGMPVYKPSDKSDIFSYGYIPTSDSAKKNFFDNYSHWDKPAFRASLLINTWESMLREDGPTPTTMLGNLDRALKVEKNPLISDFILSQMETLWWTFLTDDQRMSSQKDMEETLWTLLNQTTDKGMKSSYFRSYRGMVMTKNGLANLENIWTDQLKIPDLTLSEDDKIALAYELALKMPDKQEAILSKQIELTVNPDRKERLKFVAPALSNDEKIRDNFFESLKKEENREHEPWVLEGLSFLHHPLREKSSEKYLLSSLELLQEIQLTGDIFFPQRWLNTTFENQTSKESMKIVETFLASDNDCPEFLKKKIQQAVDMSERGYRLKRSSLNM